MELRDFVSKVLIDINEGLSKAKNDTHLNYHVIGTNDGVSFDVAVTTSNSTEGIAEGSAKLGIIQVLGVGVNTKAQGKFENSEISRIQFTVYIPSKTEEQINRQELINQQNKKNFSLD